MVRIPTSLRLRKDLREELEKMAERDSRSLSNMIELILEQAVRDDIKWKRKDCKKNQRIL